MDVLKLFKQVFAFVTQFLNVSFVINGKTFTVASFILFGLLVGLFLWFLKQLGE